MQGGCAAGQSRGVAAAQEGSELLLQRVHVRAQLRNPVGIESKSSYMFDALNAGLTTHKTRDVWRAMVQHRISLQGIV